MGESREDGAASLRAAPQVQDGEPPPQLKPCPFCGQAPLVHENDWCEPPMHVVLCLNGDCCRERATPEEAIAAWNRRASSDAPSDGYLRNCFVEARGEDAGWHFSAEHNTVVCRLDGYAIIPREKYEAYQKATGGETRGDAHTAPPSNWRDIAEAPRDGTPILIDFGPDIGVHRVAWEETVAGTTIWAVDDRKHGPYPLRGYVAADIRGWQPLPSPPGAEEARPSTERHEVTSPPSPSRKRIEELARDIEKFGSTYTEGDPARDACEFYASRVRSLLTTTGGGGELEVVREDAHTAGAKRGEEG